MRAHAGNTPVSLKVLCDAHQGIERATCPEEFRIQIQKFATGMGFEHFAYVLIATSPSLRPQRYIINGFPLAWMQKYVSRNYFAVDPVIRHALGSTLPILWGHDDADDGSSEFWEEARSYGLQTGLSFAVHDRPGVTGVFSLATDRLLDVQGQDLAALIGRAQMFASLLHQAVSAITLRELVPEGEIRLTARELECLKWTAEGKTAWEIGRILGITERTAVFHMNNVTKKFGATNKIQAIVRAAALKLL